MREIKDHSKNLCETCRYAHVVQGQRINDGYIVCTYIYEGHKNITFKVTECNKYKSVKETSLNELKEIAWLIDPKKGSVGFIKPKDLTREQRDDLDKLV